LPGGRQPMAEAGLAAMVYSGEAYNFTELRQELSQRGHKFETDSDTEVVLHGYLEWGDEVVDHLNGMYAFAIWDERDEKLVMIRDRMGIKPFYYYPTRDGVLFGSEPKAILANPLARKVVDTDGVRELMSMTKTPGWSLWKGMHEVGPGTIVTVDRSGIRTRTYWKLDAKQHTDDQETTVERVRELMTDIVHRQLIADVPRCVLLSGGLDSSAVTGLAAARLAEQGERLRTFSVDFQGQEENFQPDEVRDTPDSPFIRDVADLVGSEHQDVVLNPAELSDPEVRRKVLTARDIPAGLGDFDTSLYLLFKAIR
uniref:asparagine synthase (glutamine-hydrolyzing) n=1 Tax=Amycolatopsis sp. lyj-90 TaxID=2789285 RepID=UPI00397CC682